MREMNWTRSSPVRCLLISVASTLIRKQHKEHARYVYLQDGDPTTDESSYSDEWESDDSSASWRRGSGGGVYPRASSVSRVVSGNGRFGNQPPRAAAQKRMSLITGKYFDVPAYEGGFEHYEHGMLPTPINGKAASVGGVGSMNANLMTRRGFFQSAAGSRWDEELNVVHEKVERAREALLGHRTLLELWTGQGLETMKTRRMMTRICP
jgi:hypothetical protein